MDSQKKKVILNEISFWKKNKLLPEHYCDFLTTLYSEGQEVNDISNFDVNAAHSLLTENSTKENWNMIFTSVGAVVLLVALFVLKAPFVLIPIILSVSAIIGLLLFLFKFNPNKTLMTTFTYATIALLILGVSIKIVNLLGGNPLVLCVVLIGNCVLWLVSGRFLDLMFFKISGVVGILFIIFYMFFS